MPAEVAESDQHLKYPKSLIEIRELDQLLMLMKNGILGAESHIRLIKALENLDRPKDKDYKTFMLEVEDRNKDQIQLAAFAKEEIATGLTSLHSLFLVRLCTTLDVAIEEIVCLALERPEIWKDADLISKVSGPLVQFLNATPSERARLLYDELRVITKASRCIGVSKCEALLEPVGLGGGISQEIRKLILELIETRNVIVHRAGKVDQKLKDRCPWISENVDEKLRVDAVRYYKLSSALTVYLAQVYLRGNKIGLLKFSAGNLENLEIISKIGVTQEP